MTPGNADGSSDSTGDPGGVTGPPIGGAFRVESLWLACETPRETDASDPLIGRSFGEVTLTRFIAEGGMGRVYEADQLNPSRRVAVKVLRPGLFTRETIRRFLREVSTLGSLQHPAITKVYFAGSYEVAGTELPYFVMELIPDALPLTEFAKSRHLSITQRLDLFRQVCDAISFGHERGIVHRDLKPRNILVDGFGRPKVIDFGVARGPVGDERATTLTEAGQLVGTLQYMSPEQFSGRSDDVDARADVYALGVVLYELLAGRPPHNVGSRPLLEAARTIQDQRPKALRSVNPAVPRNINAIVQTCLAKDREARFRTAGELLAALHDTGTAGSWRRSLATELRRVPRRFSRSVIAGVTGASVILGGLYMMPPLAWPVMTRLGRVEPVSPATVIAAEPIRRPNVEAGADPAAALMLQPALIQRDARKFHFALRDVHQKDADVFLVKNVGMKKWMDQFMFPRVSYWAPAANNKEAELVYRFDFGGVAESIHLRAATACWDFFREPGGVGRGASAIEVSRDGEDWTSLGNNIEPRLWGGAINVDDELPGDFRDTQTLWVRVRCITESAPVEDGYNVAQFARTPHDRRETVFEVTATLREKPSDSAL